MILQCALEKVGNTPVVNIPLLEHPHIQVYAKLEYYNPTGSVKDRAADYMLRTLLNSGTINRQTTIIESSSGNFGVALAAYCKYHQLRFICVVDKNILPANELLLKSFNAEIIKVSDPDESGGYLLTRIRTVKEIVAGSSNIYWINQYENKLNAHAYYESLGGEICAQFKHLDYAFIGVGSCGTITGLSQRLKENYPDIRIIAVDSKGSLIFGDKPIKRYIPGIGSGMRPPIINTACIDDRVLVPEQDAVRMCYKALADHYMMIGGSSGSVLAAVHAYFGDPGRITGTDKQVLVIFPDKGEKYINTIYNPEWMNITWGISEPLNEQTVIL